MTFLRFLLIAVCVYACLACSKSSDLNVELQVEQAHMFAMPPSQRAGAVYLRLINHTDRDLTLLDAKTPIAGRVEVHTTVHEDGMMMMRPVKHLKVPANNSLEFKPSGYHLMLMDISSQPAQAQAFPLTLEFDGPLSIEVEVLVKPR